VKIRLNYVSNSSSASFIVSNWFDIPKEKRDYIKNYDVNAFEIWKKEKIKYKTQEELNGFIQDVPFCGEIHFFENVCSDDILNFGWINDESRYEFIEDEENNTCRIETYMTNFFMENWLKYNNVEFE
jgi:hypothetical protein